MWTRYILLTLLISAGNVFAQEDRPTIALPDPGKGGKTAPGTPEGTYTITMVDYKLTDNQRDRFPQALAELAQFVRSSTDLKAKIVWNERAIGSPHIMQSLFLYMTGNEPTLQINNDEKKNLGNYLKQGGLLFADDIRQPDGFGSRPRGAGVAGTPFDRQFKALMKDPLVLGGQGDRWQKIRKDHPLYSSYFNFVDGPPLGAAQGGNVHDLEMLQIRGRTAVVFSDLNISWYWGNTRASSRQRGLQFGANLIVFALTQKTTMGMGR